MDRLKVKKWLIAHQEAGMEFSVVCTAFDLLRNPEDLLATEILNDIIRDRAEKHSAQVTRLSND
jgi:hypothetical protein